MLLRFGLIGTGFWATSVHAPGLAQHPQLEFEGVWGRSHAKAREIAERYGTVAYRSLDDLLKNVDVVAFAVTPDVQAELGCRAAEAGCHLLLEKPLALSLGAADQLVSATRRSGVRSLVFYSGRFIEPTASWLRHVISPTEWDGASMTLLASTLAPGSPMAHSDWRKREGVLWDAGPHALAILIPSLGPVEEVAALTGRRQSVSMVFRHRAGAISSTTLNLTIPKRHRYQSLLFWGTSGVAKSPDLARRMSPRQAYATAVSELISAIQTGTRHECDVGLGREIVRVLSECERFIMQLPEPKSN